MADPLRIQALAAAAIAAATERLRSSGNVSAWEREMRAAITRAHTAAYLAGLAEKSAPGKVRAWLSKLVGARALSKADQAALKTRIREQLDYLQNFTDALPDMSDAQIAARAGLYAGATRATLYGAQWGDWDLPWVPGDGSTQCKSNCRCEASVSDNGDGTGVYTWTLGSEHSCTTCPERAGDHAVKRRAA